jgi:2-C-methyl-D-erythritol 4-phosphate cytidylyltransferase
MAIAILLAAGVGSRMKSDTPKQFMKINDKEIISYSLDVFQADSNITDIVLVTGEEHIAYCKENIVSAYGYTKVHSVIAGGKERYNSVYNGILAAEQIFSSDAVKGNACDGIIMIHDGARPFITHQMISDSVECIQSGYEGCTVAVPVKDTIKLVKKSGEYIIGDETPDRTSVYQIQTPQTFRCEMLHRAYDKMLADHNHNITDDTMLVEQYMGRACAIVPGSYENIKITTPEDILIGKILMENRKIFSKKILKKNKKTC